jgi:uncharacterized protein YwgA/O-acetyl-ADP-ribose deacetylase (regulator of RNase III)
MNAGVDIREGDLFGSRAQTLVNTVNCVGVMGKGVALGFKRRFPEMFDDYVRRCERGEVRLGRPYLYRQDEGPWILNFPTKEHWRSMSRLTDIVQGLEYLEEHYERWGITSLAVPPLGAGHGGLEWHVVGPTLYRHLKRLSVPVELYVPFGTPHSELQPAYLERLFDNERSPFKPGRISPDWVALLETLARLEREPYGPLVGRTLFQKLAYFATVIGLRLELEYSRSSYGPFAPGLKSFLSHLINNGLIEERRQGRMIEIRLGDSFEAAERAFHDELQELEPKVQRLVDLFARMRTKDAEVAASIHFVAQELSESMDGVPSEDEVLTAVLDWKQRRKPPFQRDDIAQAIRGLNLLGWITAKPSEDLNGDPELELLAADC